MKPVHNRKAIEEKGNKSGCIYGVNFSAGGKFVALGTWDHGVYILDATKPDYPLFKKLETSNLRYCFVPCQFSPLYKNQPQKQESALFACFAPGSQDNSKVALYTVPDFKLLDVDPSEQKTEEEQEKEEEEEGGGESRKFLIHHEACLKPVAACLFHPQNPDQVVTCSSSMLESALVAHSIKKRCPIRSFVATLKPHQPKQKKDEYEASMAAFSPDGFRIACCGGDGKVCVFDYETASLVFRKEISDTFLSDIRWLSNTTFAVGGGGGSLYVLRQKKEHESLNDSDDQEEDQKVQNKSSIVHFKTIQKVQHPSGNEEEEEGEEGAEASIYAIDVCSDFIAVAGETNCIHVYKLKVENNNNSDDVVLEFAPKEGAKKVEKNQSEKEEKKLEKDGKPLYSMKVEEARQSTWCGGVSFKKSAAGNNRSLLRGGTAQTLVSVDYDAYLRVFDFAEAKWNSRRPALLVAEKGTSRLAKEIKSHWNILILSTLYC